MRGKRAPSATHTRSGRIIPAHAGQTRRTCNYGCSCSDHPRACGANVDQTTIATRENGSSPRMRGKQILLVPLCAVLRIIPAHAGQTSEIRAVICKPSDHPRACGANVMGASGEACKVGSSPRMRGKPGQVEESGTAVRIIPAHAGQTTSPHLVLRRMSDHPRACGANSPILCENS